MHNRDLAQIRLDAHRGDFDPAREHRHTALSARRAGISRIRRFPRR